MLRFYAGRSRTGGVHAAKSPTCGGVTIGIQNTHVPQRYPELDAARGVAIIMMIIFHVVFDAAFFDIIPVVVSSGFWKLFAIATASLFLFIVGVSLAISGAHAEKVLNKKDFWLKYFFRGLFIFCIGMGITLFSWLLVPQGVILFGILHLIGVSIMLAPVFLRCYWFNLLAGMICIVIGLFIPGITGPPWLIWAGIHPASFYSLDYTPVFPWLGLVLLGIFSGMTLYPGGLRSGILRQNTMRQFPLLVLLGKHSLLIYVVHQPVILALMALLFPGAISL